MRAPPKRLGLFLNDVTSTLPLRPSDLRAIGAVRAAWDACAGTALAAHVRPLYLRGTRLLVEADGPTWMARMRYEQTRLRQCLRARAAEVPIEDIAVRLAQTAPTTVPPPQRQPLSPQVSRLLEALAADVSYAPLAAALKRLAARARGDESP